jgi:glycosyltransferase involved in cell wall biosynthesis
MALTVVHLLDEETPEDAARLTSLLLRLMPRPKVESRCVMLGRTPSGFTSAADAPVTRIGLRLGLAPLSLPALRRTLQRQPPDVLHAVGGRPAALAGMLRRLDPRLRVISTIADPSEAPRVSRWFRSFDPGAAPELLCTSGIVQRRLVEAGVPIAATAIIRPGVDFAELRIARERITRESLRLTGPGRVLVMPSPPTRAGGQFIGVWAVSILRQIWPDVRLLIPGRSREADRIGRLLRQIYCPELFRMTGDEYAPAELLSVSDALLVPAVSDIPTGWIAWAMAAGVPIIASAIPAVTEFIADRQNGFLCRPGEPHTLAIRVRTAFESPEVMRRCAEIARGQAYDVFRAQQCVDQYIRAFTSVVQGRPAATAVHDAAIAT